MNQQPDNAIGDLEPESIDQPDHDHRGAGSAAEPVDAAWADDGAAAPGSADEDLRGLVTFIVSNLLDDMDAVEVDAEQRGSSVHLRLRVPSEDLGKVIGRQGRVARAMRTALTIAGSRHNVRASLDIEG